MTILNDEIIQSNNKEKYWHIPYFVKILISIFSVSISYWLLNKEISIYYYQSRHPNILWLIQFTLVDCLSYWIITFILGIAGITILFNSRLALVLYNLFSIGALFENLYYAYSFKSIIGFLMHPIGTLTSIIVLMLTFIKPLNRKLNLKGIITNNMILLFTIISILIVMLPRLLLTY